jgi:tetratricopeptide (TPR) repeat protein
METGAPRWGQVHVNGTQRGQYMTSGEQTSGQEDLRPPRRRRRAAGGLALVVLALLVPAVVHRLSQPQTQGTPLPAPASSARRGARLPRVRDRVRALLGKARQAERAHRFKAARSDYRTALRLDPALKRARARLGRVEDILSTRAFSRAMKTALEALKEHRFGAARTALDRAAGINPRSIAVADARERLHIATREAQVSELRRKAAERISEEDWHGAIASYQKALRIDDRDVRARAGLARARQRAALNRRVDYFLENSERLYSDKALAKARHLLHTLRSVPADEPKLLAKRDALKVLVKTAREPLPVNLRSDGATVIVIEGFGRLGRFVSQQEELLPGTYTVIGSRPGYRSVRRVFTLRPGVAAPTVDVRCRDRR